MQRHICTMWTCVICDSPNLFLCLHVSNIRSQLNAFFSQDTLATWFTCKCAHSVHSTSLWWVNLSHSAICSSSSFTLLVLMVSSVESMIATLLIAHWRPARAPRKLAGTQETNNKIRATAHDIIRFLSSLFLSLSLVNTRFFIFTLTTGSDFVCATTAWKLAHTHSASFLPLSLTHSVTR